MCCTYMHIFTLAMVVHMEVKGELVGVSPFFQPIFNPEY